MPRKRTTTPLQNKTTFLLLNRFAEAVAITPKEPLALQWSEDGYGDYRQLDVVYSKVVMEELGDADERRVG